MAGEIQEPIRLNFQADLLHSGSISFGRFESESLSWERRSIFSHNRYLEEVEKYSKPGTVTEKKAYFEAEFRRKALLKQNSSESQNGGEFPTTRIEDTGNCNESPSSSDPFEYNTQTIIQQHEKEDVEKPLYDEILHGSRHDEDSISQECESQICEFLPVPENVKIDGIFGSEIEKVVGNSEEIVVDVVSEANDSSLTGKSQSQTLEKEDDTESRRKFSPKVKPALEKKKVTRSTLKSQVNIDRSQKHMSYEAQKGSMKPSTSGTSENKSLISKKTEKKSPRPSSPLPHSISKSSKPQDPRSEKPIKASSALVKKPLPTVNSFRPKKTVNLSKSQVIQSSSGFSFKTDQRAENRKEFYMKITEKMNAKEAEINQVEAKTMKKQAVEIKQFRKSINFKATPMPSFYNESTRSLDQNKVTPNKPRPRSNSVTKNGVKSTVVPSDIRPSSSNSSANRIRGSESVGKSRVPEKKEKKNETSLMKLNRPMLRGHKTVGVVS